MSNSASMTAFREQRMRRSWNSFTKLTGAERSALAAQIEDPRLGEFARRLIYFERPEVLPGRTLHRTQHLDGQPRVDRR